MNFFKRENPKTILEGLDRAQEMMDERYKSGQMSLEAYQKQAMSFRKQREKYEKKVRKEKE